MNLQLHFAPPSTSYPSRDGQFVLASDAAALVAKLEGERDRAKDALRLAIKWLRRLEQDYPLCLNEDAIEKHLMPAL